jgi:hypothetical protein
VGRRGELEYEAGREDLYHVDRELGRRVVALVHDDDGLLRAYGRDQGSLVRALVARGIEGYQARVLAIHLASFLVGRAEGVVAGDEDGDAAREGVGREVRAREGLGLGNGLYPAREEGLELAAIGVLGISQRGDSLREYGERRNIPDDETAAAHEGSREGGEGVAGEESLASSRRYLDADVRNPAQAVDIAAIGLHALGEPVIAPRERGIAGCEVTREIGLDVGERRALKTLQLHCALPSIGKSRGNFLKTMPRDARNPGPRWQEGA